MKNASLPLLHPRNDNMLTVCFFCTIPITETQLTGTLLNHSVEVPLCLE